MAPERHPSGGQRDNLRARFSLLSFVQKVAVATVAAVLSATIIALLGIQAFLGSNAPSRASSNSASSDRATSTAVPPTTITTTPLSSPAPPKYLSELPYKEGEKPERGTIEIGERDFKKSIFWEHTGIEGEGHNPCDPPWECRAVIYNLKGKYRYFTALVGGTTATRSNETYPGYWWVVSDGMTEKGSFTLNQSPVPISVPVSGVHAIELRIRADTPGEEPALAFAEAHLS